MTNAERQTHVIRILGTNKAGDVLPEMWADVERIDRMEIQTQVITGPFGEITQYQKVTIKLRWLDDPDAPDYDAKGDRNREHKVVKVCDPSLPQAELDDPNEWIPIRSILQMEVKHAGGSVKKQFKESNPFTDIDSRVIANRRITHWDTTIDDAAQAAFDADPKRKVYVERDGNRNYERIEDTEDTSQYVEHQIVKKLNRQDSQQLLSTGNDQRRVLYLRNQFLIDESHPAKLEELGKDDINPPYRLDPFQNIINVQWASIQQAVLGMIALAHPHTHLGAFTTTRSKDGKSWLDGFGSGTGEAASGLGYTVIGDGGEVGGLSFGSTDTGSTATKLAFGRPKNGPACFITAKGTTVKRGVLNASGQLEFTTVATLPIDGSDPSSGAHSCSFAGGAFFIAYGDQFSTTFLSVSFDGTNFTTGVNAFPDVASYANGTEYDGEPDPQPIAGNVAFDKKNGVYVTAGKYVRSYVFHYQVVGGEDFTQNAFEYNLMTSTSKNGTTWTAKYDVTEGYGDHGDISSGIVGPRASSSNICFAKGKFWIATGFKVKLQNGFGTITNQIICLPACGVAHSTDGKTWVNIRLPNTQVSTVPDHGTTSGESLNIEFYKTGGVDLDGHPKGFFVVSGFQSGNDPANKIEKSMLWHSADGVNWSFIKSGLNERPWSLSSINKTVTPDSAKLFFL